MEPEFRFNTYISEKDRVKESIKNASILDSVPIPKRRFEYRERIISKEISPAFRFQPHDNSERVIDFIRENGISQLQTPKVFSDIT